MVKKLFGRFLLLDNGLYDEETSTLAVADLHIGYEAALEKQGIVLPTSSYGLLKKHLVSLIDATKPEKVVIVGDVKHEFGETSAQEWKETKDLLETLMSKVKTVVVVRGNHDNFLVPLLKKYGIKFETSHVEQDVLYLHGHQQLTLDLLSDNIRYVISAHEHPAISLRDELGVKRKYKCFLVSEIFGKKLIVLPAFSPLMEGVAINETDKEDLLSPVIKASDLSKAVCYVVEGNEVYEFSLKDLSFLM